MKDNDQPMTPLAEPMECLNGMDPQEVVQLLTQEHPQVIALVISLIPDTEHAMEVLDAFPEDFQVELTQRVAEMKPISFEIIKLLDQILSNKLKGTLPHQKIGGVDKLVQLFLSSDRSLNSPLLIRIEELDPDLAQQIQERL